MRKPGSCFLVIALLAGLHMAGLRSAASEEPVDIQTAATTGDLQSSKASGKSGKIEQFWIEQKSGNDYFDQSAIRAIRKTKDLPPLPDDIPEPFLEVGINFRYPE